MALPAGFGMQSSWIGYANVCLWFLVLTWKNFIDNDIEILSSGLGNRRSWNQFMGLNPLIWDFAHFYIMFCVFYVRLGIKSKTFLFSTGESSVSSHSIGYQILYCMDS